MASPRNRKGARTERTNKLLTALELANFAQVKGGNVFETHVRISGLRVYATNGHITISIPVDDDFGSNPNTEEFMKALKRTGENVVFTVVDKFRLFMVSGKLEVYINTVEDQYIPVQTPDPPCAHINNSLLDAMVTCLAATDEKENNPVFRGIWLDGYSVAASDRHSIFQVWHGIHLPEGLIIPTDTVKALVEKAKDGTELTQLGFTYERSITFYFKDGTYIRSTLLEGKVPNYASILDQKSNQNSIPADFFEGVRTLMDFSDSGTIYFRQGSLTTVSSEGKGAKFNISGISEGPIYNGKRLLALEKYATSADFYNDRGAVFAGERMRGIVSRRST